MSHIILYSNVQELEEILKYRLLFTKNKSVLLRVAIPINNDGKKFDTSKLVYFCPNAKFFMRRNCHGIK